MSENFYSHVASNKVHHLVCVPLEKKGFKNAFSTRHAGNLLPPNNRPPFLKEINHTGNDIWTVHQTHSDQSAILDKNPSTELEADAIITAKSNVWVGIKTADCLPVLLADPQTRVVASIHAGWRGTLKRIVQKTVHRLKKELGVKPENIIGALGPAACKNCYEVGPEVMDSFKKEFGSSTLEKTLDIPTLNKKQLIEEGVSDSNIFNSEACTMHQNDLYFSHRKESKKNQVPVGRILSVIGNFPASS